LKVLVLRLTEESLGFEALELLKYYWKHPEPSIEALVSVCTDDENELRTECLLRLARIQAGEGELESAKATLFQADRLVTQGHQVAKFNQDWIALRFLDIDQDTIARVQKLVQLSGRVLEQGHFDNAMQALEAAAELHCQLPVTSQAYQLGIQIHDHLKRICEQSDDRLSMIQFEFRRCDMISSLSDNLSEARNQRDILLSSPFSMKMPYFERFHRRQWGEYFMLHQREEALYHAERYLDYCKKYRDQAEQSTAENLRLQSIVQPGRMSEDARVTLLEEVRSQLEQGIEHDRSAALHFSQIEKQLVLIEVLDELGTLQQEDREEIFATAARILDEAEKLCSKINFDKNNVFLKYQAKYLRIIFAAGAIGFSDDLSSSPSELVGKMREATLDDNEASEPTSSRLAEYMYHVTLAVQSNSLSMFHNVLKKVKEEVKRLETGSHALRKAGFLIFQGVFYYLLTDYKGATIFDIWREAGIESRSMCMAKSLACFEEALDLTDMYVKEAAKRDEEVGLLAAKQAYTTGAMELLLFQFALTICYELEDSDQTWKWTQRGKARSYSTSLWNALGGENPGSVLGLPSDLAFEDMLWVSSASSRHLVFVDWVPFGLFSEKIMLLTLQFEKDSDGVRRRISMAEIVTSTEDIAESKRKLSPARLDDSDAQRFLDPFRAIIQPLEEFTKEGDILVLSTTAPLHNIPFHAVTLGNKPLIQRNPLVYTPSLSALVNCVLRMEASEPGAEPSLKWKAAVLGAYDDSSKDAQTGRERQAIYGSLEKLADKLGTEPVVGPVLTTKSFRTQAAGADLLHFHGHGRYDQHNIMRQSLELGGSGESITMNDIATLGLDRAHVMLIACEGGVQDFSLQGDEPLGLLSMFLIGGATSALGALWPIQSTTGRKFTQIFYDYFINHVDRTELGPIVNLAMALQHASLGVRACTETQTPYHWAAFVMYGAWFCRRKPGTW
jgi:CHAT domain-containing protein